MARKIDESHETSDYMSDRETVSAGKLHFEGTVELGGTVTGQMLGILFGPESDVNGRLRFGGPVQIDGTFRGAITTDDALLVGEHAKIDADITCGAATIHGAVTGNITAKDAVALEPTSHVKGDAGPQRREGRDVRRALAHGHGSERQEAPEPLSAERLPLPIAPRRKAERSTLRVGEVLRALT